MKKLIIQITLGVISLVLAYFIYAGIQRPIKFNKQLNHRTEVVVQRLKDIREAENTYRQVNGRYVASFDTLIDFIENGRIPLIKLSADPDDTTLTKQIIDTVGYIPVIDTLFGNRDNFILKDLRYIPFSENQEFEISAGNTSRGGVTVNVIEVFAANKYFLKGMNYERFNVEPEEGFKFGSMTEPTTDGNWE